MDLYHWAGRILKRGRKIAGWVDQDSRGGWRYNVGKPSDCEYATFSGGNSPLTEADAKDRLYEACAGIPA